MADGARCADGRRRSRLPHGCVPPSPSPLGSASPPPPAADPQLRSRFRGAGLFRRPPGRRTRAPAAPPPRTAAQRRRAAACSGRCPRRTTVDSGWRPRCTPARRTLVKLDTRNNQSGSRPAGSPSFPGGTAARPALLAASWGAQFPVRANKRGNPRLDWTSGRRLSVGFCQCTCPLQKCITTLLFSKSVF